MEDEEFIRVTDDKPAPSPVPEEPEGAPTLLIEAHYENDSWWGHIRGTGAFVTGDTLDGMLETIPEAAELADVLPAPVPVEEPETEKCRRCGGTGWLDDETGLGAEMKDTVSASGCPECHVPGECGGRGDVTAPAPEIKVVEEPPTDDEVRESQEWSEQRTMSAPEIKVGQVWEERTSGRFHRVVVTRPVFGRPGWWEIFHGTSQLVGGVSEAALRRDYRFLCGGDGCIPAPSLDLEGLARLDRATVIPEWERVLLVDRERGFYEGLRQAREWLVSTPSEEADGGA